MQVVIGAVQKVSSTGVGRESTVTKTLDVQCLDTTAVVWLLVDLV